ncbi:hypothetical protein LWI28_010360 [Acer negundo]|uniref:Helicase ATP-binding domain-containing protein n=1 Tax=Acer negundo TaxID=4023 RepID=A0AAD5IDF3_ACENE|nr:hypothetical protein LWI28_010360 [Acer negundo]
MEDKESEKEFPAFPYKPYSIQMDFMKALYRSLDKGGVSMLESPTGTGKTLSMICSALHWVVDQKQKQKSETVESDKNTTNDGSCGLDDEPDWMRNFVANKDCQPNDNKIKKKKNGYGLRKSDKRRNQESCRDVFSRSMEKDDFCTKKECENLRKANDGSELNDEEFLLEEYESEEEDAIGSGKSKRKAGGVTISSSIDEEEEEEEELKVYFCSRTHSQLSQCMHERRSQGGFPFPANDDINRVGQLARQFEGLDLVVDLGDIPTTEMNGHSEQDKQGVHGDQDEQGAQNERDPGVDGVFNDADLEELTEWDWEDQDKEVKHNSKSDEEQDKNEEFEDLKVSIVSLAKDPPPKLELKELPTTLKYVYLGANKTYPELVAVEFAPTNGKPRVCEPSPETASFWSVAARFAPTNGDHFHGEDLCPKQRRKVAVKLAADDSDFSGSNRRGFSF